MWHLHLLNLSKLMVLLWHETRHSCTEAGHWLLLAVHELLALVLLLQLTLQQQTEQLRVGNLLLELLRIDVCLIWLLELWPQLVEKSMRLLWQLLLHGDQLIRAR